MANDRTTLDSAGQRILYFVGARDAPRRNNGGRRQDVNPGDTKTIIEVTGDSSLAEMLTVTLCSYEGAVHLENDPGDSAVWPTLLAKVEYGNDGATNDVLVDWKNGTTFSVPAGWLRVSCVYDRDLQSDPHAETMPIAKIGAFVGYGTRPGDIAITRSISARANDPVLIPKMASRVTILAQGTPFTSFFADTTGPIASGPTNLVPSLPIPNQAKMMGCDRDAIYVFGLTL